MQNLLITYITLLKFIIYKTKYYTFICCLITWALRKRPYDWQGTFTGFPFYTSDVNFYPEIKGTTTPSFSVHDVPTNCNGGTIYLNEF